MTQPAEWITARVTGANDKGIKIEGRDDWLNYTTQRPIAHASKGQVVRIKVAGDKWINELEHQDAPGASNSPVSEDPAVRVSIVRQTALKAAVALYAALPQAPEGSASKAVLSVAEQFESWLQR